MAWSVTRTATSEDYEKLERAAERFTRRHSIEIYAEDDALGAIESRIDWMQRPDADEGERLEGRDLERLWRRICNRAIGDDGIDCGYVGHEVK